MLSCWRVSKKKLGNSIHAQEKDFLGYLFENGFSRMNGPKKLSLTTSPPTWAENSSKHLQHQFPTSPFLVGHNKSRSLTAKQKMSQNISKKKHLSKQLFSRISLNALLKKKNKNCIAGKPHKTGTMVRNHFGRFGASYAFLIVPRDS